MNVKGGDINRKKWWIYKYIIKEHFYYFNSIIRVKEVIKLTHWYLNFKITIKQFSSFSISLF